MTLVRALLAAGNDDVDRIGLGQGQRVPFCNSLDNLSLMKNNYNSMMTMLVLFVVIFVLHRGQKGPETCHHRS